jgi:hypothetical protein
MVYANVRYNGLHHTLLFLVVKTCVICDTCACCCADDPTEFEEKAVEKEK